MMVIQRVIVMSSQSFAPSGQAAAPSNDAEYNAVYAAVTATERGRWFLAEFANRNRKADTDLILAAISRIEAAIGTGAAPPPAALPHEAVTSSGPIVPGHASGGERDEDIPSERAEAAATGDVVANSAPDWSPPDTKRGVQVLSDEDYSDAVAAIAASLTTRLEETANDVDEDENLVEVAVVSEPQHQSATPNVVAESILVAADTAKPDAEATPERRVPQDNSPRWHIEGPDFVFGTASQGEGIMSAEPSPDTPQHHAQLLGAELMSEQAPSAAREEPVRLVTPVEPQLAAAAPEATTATPVSPPELEIVPLTDISRPQLRIASEAEPVTQRPPRYGSLTVTDALSEDEVIALFG
jgi:hypothetical protein